MANPPANNRSQRIVSAWQLAEAISSADSAIQAIAHVASGVGFLGEGAIMKEGANNPGAPQPLFGVPSPWARAPALVRR